MARHARVLTEPVLDETLNLKIKGVAARHARPLSAAQRDAESGHEAASAFAAIKSAVGAAYNRDAENLYANLYLAAPYYANHEEIDLKIWFLERMVEIFDCLGEIERASTLSRILGEARRLRTEGIAFTLPDLGLVPG